jgi:hypothetical protein
VSFEDVFVLVVLNIVHTISLSGVLFETCARELKLARLNHRKQLLQAWLVERLID